MRRVFADSFYFIAVLNAWDQHHRAATEIARTLKATMVTTRWVLVETADAFREPWPRQRTFQFLSDLGMSPRCQIVPADEEWYQRGLALYGARPDKAWSLTDCISMEVMREMGLTEALTGDHHFEQAGFRALLRG